MISQEIRSDETDAVDYVLFEVGDMKCGMDIVDVQEIKKLSNITAVHHAPDYVRGVVNMRGQIVTLVDMQQRFGMGESESKKSYLTIIIHSKNELVGIIVKNVEDIVRTPKTSIDALPATMHGMLRHCMRGIFKSGESLVAIVNKDSLISAMAADKNEAAR